MCVCVCVHAWLSLTASCAEQADCGFLKNSFSSLHHSDWSHAHRPQIKIKLKPKFKFVFSLRHFVEKIKDLFEGYDLVLDLK